MEEVHSLQNKYKYCHGYNCDVCAHKFSSTQCTSHGLGCVQRNHHQHERQVESSSGTRPELQDHLCPHSRRQKPDCKSHIRRTRNTNNTYNFYLQSTFISHASNLWTPKCRLKLSWNKYGCDKNWLQSIWQIQHRGNIKTHMASKE